MDRHYCEKANIFYLPPSTKLLVVSTFKRSPLVAPTTYTPIWHFCLYYLFYKQSPLPLLFIPTPPTNDLDWALKRIVYTHERPHEPIITFMNWQTAEKRLISFPNNFRTLLSHNKNTPIKAFIALSKPHSPSISLCHYSWPHPLSSLALLFLEYIPNLCYKLEIEI